MIISNKSRDFNGPKEFDDPQLFNDQIEVWTLIIQKSTVMVLLLLYYYITWMIILDRLPNQEPDNQDRNCAAKV